MTHILLVDDDKSILQNLTEFLRQEGFSVTAAGCQKDALQLLDEQSSAFDLVLLDVSLPDGNGFALCGCIQNDYHLPVIFLTASGDEYSVVAGLNLGADDYITKHYLKKRQGDTSLCLRIPPSSAVYAQQGNHPLPEPPHGRAVEYGWRICQRQYLDRIYQTSP